ncbi:MAG: cupin domain-containing protein [Pseudomonadota bacterium]
MQTARQIIDHLGMALHPEGGWYVETWRAETKEGARPVGTAIYFLLEAEQHSHWHRVDATEIWHWYAGAPLVLSLSPNGHDAEARMLGPALGQGQSPQIIVPEGHWQSAATVGAFTLVGCTVSPGFDFAGFELAPPDWRPTPRGSGT